MKNKEIVPDKDLRIGDNKHSMGGKSVYKLLELPNVDKFSEDAEIREQLVQVA